MHSIWDLFTLFDGKQQKPPNNFEQRSYWTSLDISAYDSPKNQTKDCVKMVISILTENHQ